MQADIVKETVKAVKELQIVQCRITEKSLSEELQSLCLLGKSAACAACT